MLLLLLDVVIVDYAALVYVVLQSLGQHVLVDQVGAWSVPPRLLLQKHRRLDKVGMIGVLVSGQDGLAGPEVQAKLSVFRGALDAHGLLGGE